MDRSTEKHLDGNDHYMKCYGEYSCADNCNDCCELAKIVERLAAYEDTGLDPVEAAAIENALVGRMVAKLTEFCGVPVERLEELDRAEKDGRLVVLEFTFRAGKVLESFRSEELR